MTKSNASKGIQFVIYLGVEGSINKNNDDLRRLSKAIARTRLMPKSKYENKPLTGIKEWR